MFLIPPLVRAYSLLLASTIPLDHERKTLALALIIKTLTTRNLLDQVMLAKVKKSLVLK